MDRYFVQFAKDIDTLPSSIRQGLNENDFPAPPPQTKTETKASPPLLQYADAVSTRLDAIRSLPGSGETKFSPPVPSITLENDPASPRPNEISQDAESTTTLFASNGKPKSRVWEETLLRLLHIHCVLHASYALPEGPSGALAAIFGVLLCVFSSDIDDATTPDPDAVPAQTDRTMSVDAEASAFWAMEALVSGLREVLEEETDPPSAAGWNHALSRMLRTVDGALWADLRPKSLDPALPYYASRWVPTLFTHTLPVREVLPIWDAVFTLPPFAHDTEAAAPARCPPQVEFLLDVGVTMLTRARVSLLRLGKSGSPAVGPRSLWAEEQFALPTSNLQTPSAYSPVGTPRLMPSPSSTAWGLLGGLAEGEAGDAFLKGVKLLQTYNVEEFGGIERVLQGAWELYTKQIGRGAMELPGVRADGEGETQANGMAMHDHQQPQVSRFDRLADVVWKGLTNEATSPSPSPPPTAPPSPRAVVPALTISAPSPASPPTGFGARFRDTLWKGLTNQVDSGDSPSPDSSPVASRSASPILVAQDEEPESEPEEDQEQTSRGGGRWFGGLGDSDAAAVLAKTGTNLRVRAMDVLGRTSPKPELKPKPEAEYETPQPALSSGGSWVASLASFRLGLGTVPEAGHPHPAGFDAKPKHESLPMQKSEREVFASKSKHDSYSPPLRPSFFRPPRDSILPTASPSFSPSSFSPSSSILESQGSAIQSAFAALTGSSSQAPAPAKKSGPKPLLLNSKSLMTAHGSHPRTPNRPVSPIPPTSVGGRSRTSASSSRTSSVDQRAPGASGVVSLRRGPITSARMVGGPSTGRAALNARDSTSSAGSNRHSDHRFSCEESSAGERDLKSYSFGRTQSAGFIVDRGMDSPITVGNRDSTSTGTSGARTSPPQSLHPEEGVPERVVLLNDPEQESDDERTIPASVLLRVASDESASEEERVAALPQAKLRPTRHRGTNALVLNSGAQRDDTFAAPPSAGFSSSLEPGIAYDDNDTTPLATTPTTPDSTITIERKGATLNRSKTPRPARRSRKGTGEENTSSPIPRVPRNAWKTSNPTPSRGSTALVSGSEEEGATADVEDELYTDLINSY